MNDWRTDRVLSALDGRNPTVLAELGASYGVIGDVQFLPGYSLALTKVPGVDRLTDLPRAGRVRYLADVDLVATAVENVCSDLDVGYRRVNVEILGNRDRFLHAHIWPRYEWEPVDMVEKPVWLYPPERWQDAAHALGPGHSELRVALATELDRLCDESEFRLGVLERPDSSEQFGLSRTRGGSPPSGLGWQRSPGDLRTAPPGTRATHGPTDRPEDVTASLTDD